MTEIQFLLRIKCVIWCVWENMLLTPSIILSCSGHIPWNIISVLLQDILILYTEILLIFCTSFLNCFCWSRGYLVINKSEYKQNLLHILKLLVINFICYYLLKTHQHINHKEQEKVESFLPYVTFPINNWVLIITKHV